MANRSLNLDDTLLAYLVSHSVREVAAQRDLRAATRAHPHAGMQIGPEQGQLMALLVRLIGARRCIEVGVFTGYSALTVALFSSRWTFPAFLTSNDTVRLWIDSESMRPFRAGRAG